MKNKTGPRWSCSRCGYRNDEVNEVCMGTTTGNGRCGKPKLPQSSKNPEIVVNIMPIVCTEEQRKCDECGLKRIERVLKGCPDLAR